MIQEHNPILIGILGSQELLQLIFNKNYIQSLHYLERQEFSV